MKTEREKLEEATKKQYAQERYDELYEYVEGLHNQFNELANAYYRAAYLVPLSLFAWMSTLLVNHEYPALYSFAVLTWIIAFTHVHTKYQHPMTEISSEIDGVYKTLEKLGVLPEKADLDRYRKRRKDAIKSPFKRFKEFFERLGQNKEAYAN